MILDTIPEGRYAATDTRDPNRPRVHIYRVTGNPDAGLKIWAEYRRSRKVLVARWSQTHGLVGVGGNAGIHYQLVSEVFAAPTMARVRYSRMEKVARCAGPDCGRIITDDASVAAGLGPECRRRLLARSVA